MSTVLTGRLEYRRSCADRCARIVANSGGQNWVSLLNLMYTLIINNDVITSLLQIEKRTGFHFFEISWLKQPPNFLKWVSSFCDLHKNKKLWKLGPVSSILAQNLLQPSVLPVFAQKKPFKEIRKRLIPPNRVFRYPLSRGVRVKLPIIKQLHFSSTIFFFCSKSI